MKSYFADTAYYIALLVERDATHGAAQALTARLDGTVVTTAWVLAEVGNYLAGTRQRASFKRFVTALLADASVVVVQPSWSEFSAGLELYAKRSDKGWSLTDCISFGIMKRRRIKEALTTDHHFEQAGFAALLKP